MKAVAILCIVKSLCERSTGSSAWSASFFKKYCKRSQPPSLRFVMYAAPYVQLARLDVCGQVNVAGCSSVSASRSGARPVTSSKAASRVPTATLQYQKPPITPAFRCKSIPFLIRPTRGRCSGSDHFRPASIWPCSGRDDVFYIASRD